MSWPLVFSIPLILFRNLAYGAWVTMGVPYLVWKFGMTVAEIGSVVSLHAISQSTANMIAVPVLVRRFGGIAVLIGGGGLMSLGLAVVGFMPNWWSFQILYTGIVGFGFSCCMTCTQVVCDHYATNAIRPRMNAMIFSCDQIGFFLAGLVYGAALEVAKDEDQGFFMFAPACFTAMIYSLLVTIVYLACMRPHDLQKKKDREAVLSSVKVPWKWEAEDDPTQADYDEYGKFLVELLHERKWSWRSKGWFVKSLLDHLILFLPTDSMRHRMETLWEIENQAKLVGERTQEIAKFYSEVPEALRV